MSIDAYGEWLSFGSFRPPYYEWMLAPGFVFEQISALKIEFSVAGTGKFSSVRSHGLLRTVYYKEGASPLRDSARRVYPKQEVNIFPFSPTVNYDFLGIEVLKKIRGHSGSDWLWDVSIYGLKGESHFPGASIAAPIQPSDNNNLIF